MQRLHVIVAAGILASVAVGCASQKRPVTATTETTGAATWTTESRLQEENARLQKERDDARAALLDERADHARDLEQLNADYAARREQDELEMRALEALAVADVQAEALRNKAKTAQGSTRRSIDEMLAEMQNARAKLHAQLQRLHGASGAALDALKSDIESTMTDLERSVQPPTGPAPKKAKQAPPTTKSTTPSK